MMMINACVLCFMVVESVFSDTLNLDQWVHVRGGGGVTPSGEQTVEVEGEFAEGNQPIGRSFFASVSYNDSNNIVICGGMPSGGVQPPFRNEVWEYSVPLNQWKRGSGVSTERDGFVVPGGNLNFNETNIIPTKYGVVGWIIEEDEQEVMFFGGHKESGESYSSERWIYSLTLQMWKRIDNYSDDHFQGVNKIGGRQYFGMGEVRDEFVVILSGEGRMTSSFGKLDDVWLMNYTNLEWEMIRSSGSYNTLATYGETGIYHSLNTPGNLHKFSTAVDLETMQLFLFGGVHFDAFVAVYDGVWGLNISSSWEWKFLSGTKEKNSYPVFGSTNRYSVNNTFGGRAAFKSVNGVNGVIHVVCGENVDWKLKNDVWNFDPSIGMWKFWARDSAKFQNRYSVPGTTGLYSSTSIPGGLHGFEIQLINQGTEILMLMGYGFNEANEDYLEDIWKLELIPRCFGILATDPLVCSNSGGQCIDSKCQCYDGKFGDECSFSQCFGVFSNSSAQQVCSGSGVCIDGNCACYESTAYTLPNCTFDEARKEFDEEQVRQQEREEEERKNQELAAIDGAILISVLVLFGLFGLVCVSGIAVVSVAAISSLIKKVKRFEGLEDVELLLEEQRVGKKTAFPKHRIKKSLFSVDPSAIKMGKKLGKGGGGGIVYRGEWKSQTIAYKCFRINEDLEEDRYKEFERELEMLSSISFPFILIFYGATISESRVGILMEFCQNGDLEFFLKGKNGTYPVRSKVRVLGEVAAAMGFLHSKKVLHRDLKAENVLISDQERAKVMDFGLSKFNEDDKTQTRRVGTSIYMAPEVLGFNYSYPCDVFSFAILSYVVFTENWMPYGDKTFGIEVRVSSNHDLRPSFVGFRLAKELQRFMVRNWDHNPEKRMKFDEIAQFFENYSKVTFDEKQKNLVASSSNKSKDLRREIDELKNSLRTMQKTIDEQRKIIKEERSKTTICEEQKKIIENLKKIIKETGKSKE